jgi:hypothetical protein
MFLILPFMFFLQKNWRTGGQDWFFWGQGKDGGGWFDTGGREKELGKEVGG